MNWRETFRDKLQKTRREGAKGGSEAFHRFSRAIFPISAENWAEPQENLSRPVELAPPGPEPESVARGLTDQAATEQASETEKLQTLKSLKKFAERSLERDVEAPQQESKESSETNALKFKGGELRLTERNESAQKLVIEVSDEQAKAVKEKEGLYFSPASKEVNSPLVLFIGDTETEGEDDLLGKMIAAMKLGAGEFLRAPRLKEEDKDAMAAQILHKKPKVVVTLGAFDTHLFLNAKERLSRVHGKFYELHLQSSTEQTDVKLVPIFHPDFLRINPNMKRSAWTDLQKIMSYIGKKA